MAPAHDCGQGSLTEQVEDGTGMEEAKGPSTAYLGLLWGGDMTQDWWEKLQLLIDGCDIEAGAQEAGVCNGLASQGLERAARTPATPICALHAGVIGTEQLVVLAGLSSESAGFS